ncbi:hypothetical protein BVRB_5g104130 [Beta vulgaris subsp. vulgaris]|uniref:protein BRANCHLESS TRICHOME n=1 Tax=Beta vulgaris subsp. vulgaris TaxID=3555 RepID=UPI00053F453B|nr:protein BRANCHLESS TRICHOME [Beta vulgaris subsp. vulgaris]KMT12485.1 hypothetical protein BVRB_5g104130 [Beta vulgaris subsp. vulgaris]
MMMSASPDDLPRNHDNQIMFEDEEIIHSTCQISWKLYHNPFFSTTNTLTNHSSPLKLKHKQLQRKYSASAKYIHHLHSDLKMNISSNSNSDHQLMNSGRTQIAELKAELEMERKQRKKMEILNKKLSRELIDQVQKERMCVCEDLTKEISRLKEEMEKMKKEMDEERKMLRMAEVLREERVQMKLADAQLFYHNQFVNQFLLQHQQHSIKQSAPVFSCGESKRLPSAEHKWLNGSGSSSSSSSSKNGNVQRKASPEPENPHIKQGIKGFVEFQRAIKVKNGSNYSISCYSGGGKQSRDLGSYNKLECQKAQLRVLFKSKCPLPPYSHHDQLILS